MNPITRSTSIDFDSIKTTLQQTWPALTDEDISRAHGSVLRLIGTIEERTGQMHWEIEAQLQRIFTRHGIVSSDHGAMEHGVVPT